MGQIVKAGSIKLDAFPKIVPAGSIELDNNNLEQSAILVHNINPEQQAQNNKRALDLDMPKSFAIPSMTDPDIDEMNHTIETFKTLKGTTAQYMSDPEFAGIAKDDTENLTTMEGIVSGLKATPEVIGSMATGMLAFPLSGIIGANAPILGYGAKETQDKVLEMFTYTPRQKTAQESMELIGKAINIFKMAGQGWAGITEGLSTLDLQKASDVAQGKEGGSNFMVPVAGTIGEASAMFGLGEVVRVTKEHITKIVDTSKASKIKARDPEAHNNFVNDLATDHEPIRISTDQINQMFKDSSATPEEMLSDPVSYWESNLSGEPKIDIPVSDIAKMSDIIKPEDINGMTIGEIPSVNDLNTSLNKAKVKEEGMRVSEAPEGTTRVPSAAKRAEQDAIAKKLTEGIEDMPKVDIESAKKWAEDAQALMDNNYNQAKRIAMGEELPPENIRVGAVYEAVKIRALQEGDINTIQKLATESTVPSRAVELGREIKAFDSGIENDPIRDAQSIVKDRKEKTKRTGKKTTDEKTLTTSKKKAEEAQKKLEKHNEKQSKEKLKEFIRDHEKEIGSRKTRENIRKVDKASLDKEFKGLSQELNKILSPNKLTSGIDPTAIPVLVKMAKNRIEAGIITVEGLVDSIYFEIQDVVQGISKRDIRDAISGYGKTIKMSTEPTEVQLRELKRQARLVSALEDAEKGQAPLRSGLQRDPVSDEVRTLQKQVQEEMRKSGVKTQSPEQQMKSALDAVKTRLKNQIKDLTKQIETGEKTPKKTGIKYDEEANALKAERDILKKAIEDIEGKPVMTDEQRIKVATSAVERSIAEYERRIKERDLEPKKKDSKTPETPELKKLREQRDKLKEQYKKMQEDAKPPKDPEASKLKSYKTRLANEIAKLEEKIAKGDFEKTERGKTVLDAEGEKLKQEYDRAKEDYKNLSESYDGITKEEISELVKLSKEVADAKKEMERGSDRMVYGVAKIKYDNFVDKLKTGDDSVPQLLKDRLGEFKTTAKDNPTLAGLRVVGDAIVLTGDTTTSALATLDNSFLGRQGIYTAMTHPSAWHPAAVDSFNTFVNTLGPQTAWDALRADIVSRPNYLNGKYQKAGILVKTEEQFPTSIPGRIPVVGRVFKASEVAFAGTGLKMRTDLFDLLEKNARSKGLNTSDPKLIQDLGKLTGSLTARGTLGRAGETALVRYFFWAGKMLAADFEVLTAHWFGAGLNTWWARKQAAINIGKIVGETAIIMTIANALSPGSAETDPLSSDFGKIKINDTRIGTPASRMATIVTLADRLVTGARKSTSTGLTTKYSSDFSDKSRLDAVYDFLENKERPPVAFATQLLRGVDREGNEITLSGALYQNFTPISAKNFWELDTEDTADAVAGAIVDLIGINANTYRDDSIQTGSIISRFRKNKPLTAEQLTIYEQLTDKQKDYIDKMADMTAMQAGFYNLSLDNKLYAWSKASLSQREELSEIYNESLTNHANNNIDTADELNAFEQRINDAEKGKYTKKQR